MPAKQTLMHNAANCGFPPNVSNAALRFKVSFGLPGHTRFFQPMTFIVAVVRPSEPELTQATHLRAA
jgi:hypothetical protein